MADHINRNYIKQFFGLPDTQEGAVELSEIESRLVRFVYENGEDICEIGAESDGMYFIDSGTAVVLNGEGDQVNILHKGNYFGEYAALTGEKRLSTVRSLGRTVGYASIPRVPASTPSLWRFRACVKGCFAILQTPRSFPASRSRSTTVYSLHFFSLQ